MFTILNKLNKILTLSETVRNISQISPNTLEILCTIPETFDIINIFRIMVIMTRKNV